MSEEVVKEPSDGLGEANSEELELEIQEQNDGQAKEFIEFEQACSIVESLLFATDKPMSLSALTEVFSESNIDRAAVKEVLEALSVEYAAANRGVSLEEVTSGYQLRTKIDNQQYLRRHHKGRPFKLSGPALEVLAIVAYKQPLVKVEIDEVRGVDSGHLLRALMDKGLVQFAGKSELPGKPMQYQTTRKFLEIFGLRNLNELPTLTEIDEILPEGVGEDVDSNDNLGDLTDQLSEELVASYSQGEDELLKITEKLNEIHSTTEFFEEEKRRQKEQKEKERAESIQEALMLGDEVSNRDIKWLERYQVRLQESAASEAEAEKVADSELVATEQNEGAESPQDSEQLITESHQQETVAATQPVAGESAATEQTADEAEIAAALKEFENADDSFDD